MHDFLMDTVKREAQYYLNNEVTLRIVASIFGVSKSAVHYHFRKCLKESDPELYKEVALLLDKNREERCYRGGRATAEKYRRLRGGSN